MLSAAACYSLRPTSAVPPRSLVNQPIDPQLAAVRLPPHSIEAEQSVLGGLLLDNTAWDRIADLIGTNDFYRQDHQYIFGAISRLVDASKPADSVTVFEALRNTGRAEQAGGLVYLNSLAQNTPSAANIRRYAELVRERSVLRRLGNRGRRDCNQRAESCRTKTPNRYSTKPRPKFFRSPRRARADGRVSSRSSRC